MSLKFWDAAEKRRKKIQEGMGGASVIDLYRGVLAQEQEHDASYDEVTRVERRRRSAGGGGGVVDVLRSGGRRGWS